MSQITPFSLLFVSNHSFLSVGTTNLYFEFDFTGLSDINKQLATGRCINVTYVTDITMTATAWDGSRQEILGPFMYDFTCTDPTTPYPNGEAGQSNGLLTLQGLNDGSVVSTDRALLSSDPIIPVSLDSSIPIEQ